MVHTNFTPFPILTTQRLVLRLMTADDVNELFFIRSDEEMMRYIDRPPAKSVDEVIKFIEAVSSAIANNESINWAISHRDDARLIGNICFWRIDHDNYRAEIGYTLHPAWQGKGIMHEAMQAVLDYGFSIMKLHSVEANVNAENQSSIKVLERCGFVREGYFKENYFYNGKFLDSAIYSLLTPVK